MKNPLGVIHKRRRIIAIFNPLLSSVAQVLVLKIIQKFFPLIPISPSHRKRCLWMIHYAFLFFQKSFAHFRRQPNRGPSCQRITKAMVFSRINEKNATLRTT